jgi:hypothetical protein
MALLWTEGQQPERLLAEHDLIRAHIAAPHVLATWQARDAAHWRRASIGLLIGAAIPLFGCFVLQWSIATVLAAIVMDVYALWICDVLKGMLAPQRTREEHANLEEAADVRQVMRALLRTRRPSALQRDLLAAAPRVGYYFTPPGAGVDPRLHGIAWVLLLLLLMLLGLCFIAAFHFLPTAWPWLLLGVVLRIGGSIVSTLWARRSPDPAPTLLLEAPGPMLAFGGVAMICVLLMKVGGNAITSLPQAWLGSAVLILYFLFALTISQWSLQNVRAFVADLRHFIAQDREQLRDRVQRVNGDAG